MREDEQQHEWKSGVTGTAVEEMNGLSMSLGGANPQIQRNISTSSKPEQRINRASQEMRSLGGANLTKNLFEMVKRGDIKALQEELDRHGMTISSLIDDGYRHNAMFYASLIKEEEKSLAMCQWLVN